MVSHRIAVAFDVYGTLISTASISETLAVVLEISVEKADSLSAQWRTLQLEYSWRITCMKRYVSFRELTRASLLHVLALEGYVEPDQDKLEKLLMAYDGLPLFPDAAKGLGFLGLTSESPEASKMPNMKIVVFSNGSDETIKKAAADAKIDRLDGVVSVQPTSSFKPAPSTYHHLLSSLGSNSEEIWLVSSNPFDVVGVLGVGDPKLKALWVDRAGTGWIDQLGSVIGIVEPTKIVPNLEEAAIFLKRRSTSGA